MNKKFIIPILIVVIVAITAGVGIWWSITNKRTETGGNMDNQNTAQTANKTTNDANTAVVYFSATGNTEKIAEYIKDATGGDLIEIVPTEPYTDADLNYGNDDSRANQEQNDLNARPEIANKIDAASYDTVFLGYPIWWGDAPKIILSFLDETDLSGKTVIPFCTSGSTGISTSENTLKNYVPDANWQSGHRFSSSASQSDVENWVEGLNL